MRLNGNRISFSRYSPWTHLRYLLFIPSINIPQWLAQSNLFYLSGRKRIWLVLRYKKAPLILQLWKCPSSHSLCHGSNPSFFSENIDIKIFSENIDIKIQLLMIDTQMHSLIPSSVSRCTSNSRSILKSKWFSHSWKLCRILSQKENCLSTIEKYELPTCSQRGGSTKRTYP